MTAAKGVQRGVLFDNRGPAGSRVGRWTKRLLAALAGVGLFLLPLFGWLAAEPTPYRAPDGLFSFTAPDGWSTDDSGHMGPGLVARGLPSADGVEPLIHLTHEPAGKVTLEVRWQTLVGQMRFDNERMRFMTLEEHPEAVPPYAQTMYLYQRGGQGYQALTRLVLADGRFFEMTAAVPETDFDLLYPTLTAAFDSLRVGAK
jgi:hypothetical protein